MAQWTQVNGDAVTTERRVRVQDDAGREGFVDLAWGQGGPRFLGSVYTESDDSAEGREPTVTRTVLDGAPSFR